MFRILQRFELALTPALARKAAVALVLAYGAALVLWLVTAPGGVRPDGSPVGSDFVLFHAAGRLALHGALASAYDGAAISAVEQAAVPGESLVYLWRYPPPLALLLLPLGALPYFVAYALWSCAGLAAFVGGVRRLLRGRDGLLLAAGSARHLRVHPARADRVSHRRRLRLGAGAAGAEAAAGRGDLQPSGVQATLRRSGPRAAAGRGAISCAGRLPRRCGGAVRSVARGVRLGAVGGVPAHRAADAGLSRTGAASPGRRCRACSSSP